MAQRWPVVPERAGGPAKLMEEPVQEGCLEEVTC